MKPLSQRGLMRELFRRHRGSRESVIRAYAQSERKGEVARRSNVHNLSREDYATRLFGDGERKGWLDDH